MATVKDLETKVAVQGEKIDNIEQSIRELKDDTKDNYEKLSDAMTKHTEQSQAANAKIVWYLLGGMGTIVLFLLGIMFK
jgi:uncharacterized coiled-coil protein SlyX